VRDVDWIHLAQDRVSGGPLINQGAVSFLRTLLSGVCYYMVLACHCKKFYTAV
jgi:hypothetical protein